jgi:hypothetical protein
VAEALERASRFGGDPGVAIATADLYTRLGMVDEAVAQVADLLAARPSLAADPVWASGSPLAALFPPALAAAREEATSPWELALMAGDADEARELAGVDGSDLAHLVIDAWSGDAGALAELQTEARLHPYDTATVTWAARLSARAADSAAASDFRRIIVFTTEAPDRIGFESRIAPAGSAAMDGALPVDYVYGADGYRRITPDRLLAAGLPTVVDVDLAAADGPP